MALAKGIELFLLEHYPAQVVHVDGKVCGHLIQAEVNHKQGIVVVSIPQLMGQINKFILKIDQLSVHSAFVAGMHRAVGELLERYRLPRGKTFDHDLFAEAVDKAPLIGIDNAKVPE